MSFQAGNNNGSLFSQFLGDNSANEHNNYTHTSELSGNNWIPDIEFFSRWDER